METLAQPSSDLPAATAAKSPAPAEQAAPAAQLAAKAPIPEAEAPKTAAEAPSKVPTEEAAAAEDAPPEQPARLTPEGTGLVVRESFWTYARGDKVADCADVERIYAEGLDGNCVRVTLEAEAKAPPPPESPEAASADSASQA